MAVTAARVRQLLAMKPKAPPPGAQTPPDPTELRLALDPLLFPPHDQPSKA